MNLNKILQIKKVNIHIAGNFRECGDAIDFVRRYFQNTGFEIHLKTGSNSLSIQQIMKNSDVFMPIIGVEKGDIELIDGRTLPQMEVDTAIEIRKPILPIMKDPLIESLNGKQNFLRKKIKADYGPSLLTYNNLNELEQVCEKILINGVAELSKELSPMKVFISYSHQDEYFANKVHNFLANAEYEVTIDKFSFRAGKSISESITKSIQSTSFFILCLSQNAFDSPWVRKEIKLAMEMSKNFEIGGRPFIIPIKIGNFTSPRGFKKLTDLIYIDLDRNLKGGLNKLLATLRADEF